MSEADGSILAEASFTFVIMFEVDDAATDLLTTEESNKEGESAEDPYLDENEDGYVDCQQFDDYEEGGDYGDD